MKEKNEYQFKKHVRVVCDLEIGMTCRVLGYGKAIPEDIQFVITDINRRDGCESTFMVSIDDYNDHVHVLDSGWITIDF